MKLLTTILAASVIGGAMLTGCTMAPSESAADTPAIHVSAAHLDARTGETTMLSAKTVNLVGAKNIQWQVSPDNAKIEPQGDGQTAMFSADQPGVYIVKAYANEGNGNTVASDTTTITVKGPIRNANNR